MTSNKYKSSSLVLIVIGVFLAVVAPFSISAENEYSDTIKQDYVIGCRSDNCAMTLATRWSMASENRDGVAVTVRMGVEPVASDEELKAFLIKGLEKFGVDNVKFFFEQNDMPATGITLHVRGGTDGIYTLANVNKLKEAVKRNARLAKNELFK